MRKKIVLIGLVLLIIGVVILGISLYETAALSDENSALVQVSTGEWRSNLISMNSTGILEVTTSVSSDFGLVPASEINVITASNLASHVVNYDTPSTAGSLNAFTYDQISGNYYFVIFSSSTPSFSYTYLPAEAILFGEFLVVGSGIAFVGLIMAIVGAILKKKVQPVEENL